MDSRPARSSSASSSLASLIAEHYGELHVMASARARREGRAATPTSLVHETSLRLLGQEKLPEGKEQFLAVAAILLSRVVLDGARSRKALKRGGGARPELLSDVSDDGPGDGLREDVRGAVRAMAKLSEEMPRKAEALTLHVLCGMPMARVAESLGVSIPTAERDVRLAKAWIADRVNHGASE